MRKVALVINWHWDKLEIVKLYFLVPIEASLHYI